MDNKVLDEAVEVALTAYVNSRGSYEGEVPASSDDIRAALLAGVKVLLGEPVAWQVLDKRGEVIAEYTNEDYANEILGRYEWHGSTKRPLYAPSLGEGDGR